MEINNEFSGTLMWIPGLLSSGKIVNVDDLASFTKQYRHLMILGSSLYGAVVSNNKVNWFFKRSIEPINSRKVKYSDIPNNFKTHLLLMGIIHNA